MAVISCGCGDEQVPDRKTPKIVKGVVHRYGKPCYEEHGRKTVGVLRAQALAPGLPARPLGPLGELAESFARLALDAQEDRKKHEKGSWEDGEAAGRFNAYRNVAARVANLARIEDPLADIEGG